MHIISCFGEWFYNVYIFNYKRINTVRNLTEVLNMKEELIPEPIVVVWEEEGDSISIQKGNNRLILNRTASLVWKHIDGIKTMKEIFRELLDETGGSDTEENVKNVLTSSLELFLEEKLIRMRDDNELDGWLDYE